MNDATQTRSHAVGKAVYDGQTFVIYAIPRSGSNLLVNLLNSHADVLCHYELFATHSTRTEFQDKGARLPDDSPFHDLAVRDREPLAYLDALYALGGDYRAQGFKFLPHHARTVLDATLADPVSRSIALTRGDLLRAFVSERIALQTRAWNSVSQKRLGTANQDRRVRFGRYAYRLFLLRRQAYQAAVDAGLKRAGKPRLALSYEELVASPGETLARIGAFLGVDPEGFRVDATRLRRQNPEPLEELVTNPDQMRAFVARFGDGPLPDTSRWREWIYRVGARLESWWGDRRSA